MYASRKYGPPVNIKEETLKNTYYHKVFRTTQYQQWTLRSLLPGEDLPWEVHPETTQFVRIEAGSGFIQKGSEKYTYPLKDDFADDIVEGTRHRIYVSRDATEPLKMYIIYSGKILHAPDEVQHRQPK